MPRSYSIRPRADWHDDHRGVDSLAREIIEDDETIDIGITDQFGNKIVARQKRDPVGFIRFPEKS